MVFSRQKIVIPHGIFIANTKIERKTEARFLGVIMDEKLNFTQHIKALKSKMSRYVGVMYKLKGLVPVSVMLQIYHSFIQSHINYCSLVWGFSAKSNIESLFTGQKKGIRSVMPGFVKFFYKDGITPAHTKPGFTKFKGKDGKPLAYHHGFQTLSDGVFTSKYVTMGVCEGKDGFVNLLVMHPYSLLRLKTPR